MLPVKLSRQIGFYNFTNEQNNTEMEKIIKLNHAINKNVNSEFYISIINELSANVLSKEDTVNCKTPLQMAIIKKNIPVIKLLIESGVDVQVKNKNGCDAIHYALLTGNTEIIKLVSQYGFSKTI